MSRYATNEDLATVCDIKSRESGPTITPKTMKTTKVIVLVGIAVVIAGAGFFSYRTKRMERLYFEAIGYPEFHGSSQSKQAVRTLADYHGRRATGLLVGIALTPDSFLTGSSTLEAIKALGERNDPDVAPILANLLQPQEELATRKAAAEALQHLPCSAECVDRILQYLFRVSSGEPNYEDRWVDSSESPDSVTATLRQEQQESYQSLYAVLVRQKSTTLAILTKVYGLGTDAPSTFSLQLLPNLKLRESCPALLRSNQAITKQPDTFIAPRAEIRAAIASLSCK